MSGHLPCTDTLSMSRHISTLNYLRSADTCLTRTRTVIYWLSVPAITDSSNKCHVFGGHFNPKSLAAGTLTCDRHFAQMSMLPSGDRQWRINNGANGARAPGPRAPGAPHILKKKLWDIIIKHSNRLQAVPWSV